MLKVLSSSSFSWIVFVIKEPHLKNLFILDGHIYASNTLTVFGRNLFIKHSCGSVARFTFEDLCIQVSVIY